jgi:hypothetical protein
MDFKKLIVKFCYRVEAKPEGGFIARCSDPSQPTLEGATRSEVEQKIRDRISGELATQFPALKDLFDQQTIQHTYHVEAKPGGGFVVNSGDPAHGPIEASTREHLEDLVASKFISHLMDKLPPDAVQQFSAQLGSGNMNVTVTRKVTFTRGGDSAQLPGGDPLPGGRSLAQIGEFPPSQSSATVTGDSPVVRFEKSGSATFFRLLFFVLAVIAITYFFLHHR